MHRILHLTAVACLLWATPVALGQVIYDNASSLAGAGTYGLVTTAGGGFGGADLSALTAPDANFGFTANTATVFRIADNFTVPAGFTWTITGANFFGYTTGATATTLIGATVQVFNGDPSSGGSVIAGNTSTNVQTGVAFAGPTPIWRASSTTPLANNRQIQISTTTLGAALVLSPGTYWIDYALTSSTGLVFTPPMSLTAGGAVTGDALQFNGTAYVPIVEGTAAFKGIPFQLLGTITAVPEPTTWALMGVGVIGAAGWMRRRMKKNQQALESKLSRR